MNGQEELLMFTPEEITMIISAVLGLIFIITFFVISHRLLRVIRLLQFFQRLENHKPENWILIHCKNCHHEFRVSKGSKDKVLCPKCKILNVLLIK